MSQARKVVHRSPVRSVGIVSAVWIEGGPFEHESQTEKGFLELIVPCPIVKRIDPQPFFVPLEPPEEGHTPDYLVTLKGGEKAVVEVKPPRFVQKNAERFNRIAAVLARRSLPYYVMSHCEPGDAEVEEAALWRRYSRTTVDEAAKRQTLSLAQAGESTLASLQAQGIRPSVIYHLLGRGLLVSSTGFHMTSQSRLFPYEVEEHLDERIFFERWIGCQAWPTNMAT